ncbi:MAG: hypothetical protein ACKV2V_28405 [Blastocatellia bacterium]
MKLTLETRAYKFELEGWVLTLSLSEKNNNSRPSRKATGTGVTEGGFSAPQFARFMRPAYQLNRVSRKS